MLNFIHIIKYKFILKIVKTIKTLHPSYTIPYFDSKKIIFMYLKKKNVN